MTTEITVCQRFVNLYLKITPNAWKYKGGGQDPKKSLVLTTSGGQDPQKAIGFDHFIQENAHFFLILQKVGPFFLDFTESWGKETGGRGQDKIGGHLPRLSTPGTTTA